MLYLSFIQKKKRIINQKKSYFKSYLFASSFLRSIVQRVDKNKLTIDSPITICITLTFNILQIFVGWLGKWIDRDLPYRFQQMAPRIPATLLRLLRVRLAKSNEARTRFICRSSSLPNIDRFLSVMDGS